MNYFTHTTGSEYVVKPDPFTKMKFPNGAEANISVHVKLGFYVARPLINCHAQKVIENQIILCDFR